MRNLRSGKMNSRGLNSHDIILFFDLLKGANDTQLVYLSRELETELTKRIMKRTSTIKVLQ